MMQPHHTAPRFQDCSQDFTSEKDDIAQDEDSLMLDKHITSKREVPSRYSRLYFVSVALILIISILISILAASSRQLRSVSSPPLQSCGQTPQEAKSLGCHFDLLSFAWQTPECYDAENTEAFLNHNVNTSWTHFADPYDQIPRTEEEALSRRFVMYVTAEYHFMHCTYMWRQMHRAYMLRGYIDEHLENWHHTLHCQGVLLGSGGAGGEEMRRVNTVGRIIYPKCRKIWR